MLVECLFPKTGKTHYHAQLGRPDKGRAIKELIVCNSWNVSSFEPTIQISFYLPSLELLGVYLKLIKIKKYKYNNVHSMASKPINIR